MIRGSFRPRCLQRAMAGGRLCRLNVVIPQSIRRFDFIIRNHPLYMGHTLQRSLARGQSAHVAFGSVASSEALLRSFRSSRHKAGHYGMDTLSSSGMCHPPGLLAGCLLMQTVIGRVHQARTTPLKKGAGPSDVSGLCWVAVEAWCLTLTTLRAANGLDAHVWHRAV